MTELQARLFAGRAVRGVQAQEELARRLRPGGADVPAQRSGKDASSRKLNLVHRS
jgi:hypothetical protein